MNDVLEIVGATNIFKTPTCFKADPPTIIDIVLTNAPKRLYCVTTFDCGLSDFHHMVCFASRLTAPVKRYKHITYRSYKKFDEQAYNHDLFSARFHVAEIFDCIDDAYWFSNKLIIDVIDEHAHIKKRKVKHNAVPYMNNKLRKAINVKNMLKRKYDKIKIADNWQKYRNQRNLVQKLRKQSARNYIKDKCTREKQNSKEFWQTVKPLISNKCKNNDNIVLMEDNNIVNNPQSVCNILNDFYVNITKDIGQPDPITQTDLIEEIIEAHSTHGSVLKIKELNPSNDRFEFKRVGVNYVYDLLKAVNPKKATGYDLIPPKLLKLGARALSVTPCNILSI